MSIYNNIACVVLSRDKDGEVWVHFGVELKDSGKERVPHLSIFGGEIDQNEMAHNPFEALKKEIHEETLGLLDTEISLEKLSTPEQTYTFSYTDPNPANMTHTIICVTLVEHEKMEEIKNNFLEERQARLYKELDKRFKTQAETEVKEIRSVKLSDLKASLSNKQNVLDFTLKTSEPPSSFLSLDNTKIKEENGVFSEYEIYQSNGKPVETVISQDLSLRPEIAQFLRKALPGLEYRFFNTPIITPPDFSKGFYGKTVRADEFCYIDEFIDTTPIKGLTRDERRSQKRQGRRGAMLARGSEAIDYEMRAQYGIGKQYTEEQKSQYADIQSISYFSVEHGTPAFGFSKERSTRLIGVAGIDLLPNRLYKYDGGTVGRPYDENNIASLEQYIRDKALNPYVTSYDISDLNAFISDIETTGSQKYNEILARISWDVDKTSICVYSDNQETRWIAIAWARKVEEKIKEKSAELYRKQLISKEQFDAYQDKTVKISYYNQDLKKNGYYTESQLKQDEKRAIEIFDDIYERKTYLDRGDYEFLLMIQDEKRLEEVLSDYGLMKELFSHRNYIAEALIERRYKITNEPFFLGNSIKPSDPTRSFLEKIQKGMIVGSNKSLDGRIRIEGNFSNKDFSGMDLSNFDFSGSTFEKCALENVKLNFSGSKEIQLKNCNLTDTHLSQADFSNIKIDETFICNTLDYRIKAKSSFENEKEYYRNFDKNKMFADLHAQKIPDPELIHFALDMAVFYADYDSMTTLVEKYDAINRLTISNPSRIFDFVAKNGSAKIMKALFDKYPKFDINATGYSGQTLLRIAVMNANYEMVSYLLERNAKIEEDCLEQAAFRTDLHMIDLLLPKVDQEQLDNALFSAIANNSLEVVERLLSTGASCNVSRAGKSLLFYAFGKKHIFDRLLSEVTQEQLDRALLEATYWGFDDVVKTLISKGARWELKDRYGKTALVYATEQGNHTLIELFDKYKYKDNQEAQDVQKRNAHLEDNANEKPPLVISQNRKEMQNKENVNPENNESNKNSPKLGR